MILHGLPSHSSLVVFGKKALFGTGHARDQMSRMNTDAKANKLDTQSARNAVAAMVSSVAARPVRSWQLSRARLTWLGDRQEQSREI